MVRVHANRLRRIPHCIVETGDPQDGVFPDSLRTLGRISATKTCRNKQTGELERNFWVRNSGKRSAAWTAESDLPATVVKRYEDRDGTGTAARAQQVTQHEVTHGAWEESEEGRSSEDDTIERRDDQKTENAEKVDETIAEIGEHSVGKRKVTWEDRTKAELRGEQDRTCCG